ncbi:GtrA family protein [Pseudodesulfovibrio profundus]|uniref:GtrA family protein n=1 Tax=Pseudodesulfovibrio profundus TaxID=57320 RepID=UPI000BE43E3C
MTEFLKKNLYELVRYIFVGIILIIIFFVISNVLYHLGLTPSVSTLIANCIQIVVAYVLNRKFTFRSNISHVRSIPRYALRSLINIIFMQLTTFFFYEVAHLSFVFTSILSACLTTTLSYFLAKYWVFCSEHSG